MEDERDWMLPENADKCVIGPGSTRSSILLELLFAAFDVANALEWRSNCPSFNGAWRGVLIYGSLVAGSCPTVLRSGLVKDGGA